MISSGFGTGYLRFFLSNYGWTVLWPGKGGFVLLEGEWMVIPLYNTSCVSVYICP